VSNDDAWFAAARRQSALDERHQNVGGLFFAVEERCLVAARRGLTKFIRVEWNRLNLDGVEQRDKHFSRARAGPFDPDWRCRGLF
jgi:hypothetical protein